MATNSTEHSELQTAAQRSELGVTEREQAPRTRRRSSTFRRAARNVGSFGQNRSHQIRPSNHDASVLFSHRARTRSLARIEAEQQQQQQQEPADPPKQWKPSIVLGSSLWLEDEDINAIEIADRKVAQTRLWASHYQGVPYFEEAHQEAIREREQLDETAEENILPRSALKSTHDAAIQQRLGLLRFLLQDSPSPDERANIEAAIAGYESGAIPYSDSYTLIWAGHIVDRCPDFDSFTANRSERLDRYAAEYGPGWLWYEPPLAFGGGTVVAKKGFCLESKATWRRGTDNMGHYRIRMGFRRRKQNVSRGAGEHVRGATSTATRRRSASAYTPAMPTAQTIPQPNTSLPDRTIPDPDGPRVAWELLLDSGATLPSLYEGDLPKLGIHRDRYAAQSARTVNTADSVLQARVYELDVAVLGGEKDVKEDEEQGGEEEQEESTTRSQSQKKTQTKRKQPTNPVSSSTDPEPLSCTIPVLVFAGAADDHGGDSVPGRLSGLLPFHVCYVSGAPGSFKLWMGEDRRDVLGAARLPGLSRYGEILGGINAMDRARRVLAPPATTPTAAPKVVVTPESWARDALQTPERVVFEHSIPDGTGRVLREEDFGDAVVTMSGPRGTDFERLDARKERVHLLRIKRKKHPADPAADRPKWEVKRPVRKGADRDIAETPS